MGISRKAAEIIARTGPQRTADRIRLVWEEVTAMRENYLTYKQIVAILKAEYGIVIRPDAPGKENTAASHLASIMKRIQKQQVFRNPAQLPSQSASSGADTRSRFADPIEAARRRYEDGRRPLFGSQKDA